MENPEPSKDGSGFYNAEKYLSVYCEALLSSDVTMKQKVIWENCPTQLPVFIKLAWF